MRVGVVGVGAMGQHHARVYSELAEDFDLELVGIADQDVERAEELADEYGYEGFYKDYKKLAEQDLDALTIAVPTTLHKLFRRRFIKT